MTTANIILAACLVVLCGIAVYLIVRYMRKNKEANAFLEQVESAIKDLNNDSFDAMHVGYSVQTEVPFADAPDTAVCTIGVSTSKKPASFINFLKK